MDDFEKLKRRTNLIACVSIGLLIAAYISCIALVVLFLIFLYK